MTYSMDFRRAVAAAYDECGSSAEVDRLIQAAGIAMQIALAAV